VIVNTYVLKMFSTSIHMVLKNLDIRDAFPQKHGNAHVYPHENTKIAMELQILRQKRYKRYNLTYKPYKQT
jgi:hypothetical protein